MVKVIFGIDDANHFFMERLHALEEFQKEFPKLKATHFVPANYFLLSRPRSLRLLRGFIPLRLLPFSVRKCLFNRWEPRSEENRIDLQKEFIDLFNKNISKGRFSAELHGWTHFCPENLSAEEFLYLGEKEASERVEKSIDAFRRADFPKPKVMAPPGWAVTNELLSVLLQKKLAIAGSMTSRSLGKDAKSADAGIKGVSALHPKKFHGVLSIPRNWDLKWGTIKRARRIIELGGMIGVHGHVAPIGVFNDLSPGNLGNLRSLLEFLEKEKIETEFLHFRELV